MTRVTGAFVYPAARASPAFIELADDDLPVAPKRACGWPARATSTSKYADEAARAAQAQDAKRLGCELTVPSPADAPDVIPEDVIADTDDLAAVVVKRTMRQMAAGKLTPTLRDGLQAQQLLDRRAEKAADRSFMLNLALRLGRWGLTTPHRVAPTDHRRPR